MQQAMRRYTVQADALSSPLFHELVQDTNERLDNVHGRLRRLNVMLGMVVNVDGIGDEAASVLFCVMDAIDACLALSGHGEVVQ